MGGLTGGVHLSHQQRIRLGQRFAEVVDQIVGARVAMRLEGEHEPPVRISLA